MKQIKLEVGKTYRNRKGEEVKIVRKVNEAEYHYRGSNNEWYDESGKWSYYSEEHPKDLIEEVTVSDANQKHNKMKTIGKCEVCGGKIIQAGNGNIFCEDCADKNFRERLQEWADKKEKQRIVKRAMTNER